MATTLQFDIIARDLASRTFNKIGARSSLLGKTFAGFGAAATGALKGATLAVGAFGAVAAKTGLETAASLERAQISFQQFTGSAETAAGLIDKIKKFTLSTPFELPGLIDTSKRLLGVGVSAKDLIPTIGALGDTAAAFGLSGEQFNRVTLAISQSLAKGRFQQEEFNQVSEAGIPILKILSKAMDLPIPKLLELSRTGDLLASDVFPKLLAQMRKDYGGAMSKQVQTLTGLWTNLMDTLRIGAADALEPLIPLIKNRLADATKALSGGFKKVGEAFKTATPLVLAFINGLQGGQAFGGGPIVQASEAGQKLRDVLMDIGDTLSPVVQGFKDLEPAARNLLEFFGELATGAGNFFKELIDGAKPLGGSFVDTINDVTEELKDLPFKKLGTEAGKLASKIIDDLTPALEGLLPVLEDVAAVLKPILQTIADNPDVFGPIIEGILIAVVAFKSLKAAITGADKFVKWIKNLKVSPVTRAAGAIGILATAIIFLEEQTGAMTLRWEKLKDEVAGAGQVILTAFGAIISAAGFVVQSIQFLNDKWLAFNQSILEGAAKVAEAVGNFPLAVALREDAAELETFRQKSADTFQSARDEIAEWNADVKAMQDEIRIKGDIRDLLFKIKTARRELDSDKTTKTRKVELRAIIDQLRRQVRDARDLLASVKSKEVTITVRRLITGPLPSFVTENARGTMSASPGLSLVGERGPELVAFRGGERVFTASQTRAMVSGFGSSGVRGLTTGGGTTVVNVHFSGPVGSSYELRNWLVRAIDDANRYGRLSGISAS